MAATVMMKEAKQMAATTKTVETQPMCNSVDHVMFEKCECCGLTEECTEAYILLVRERYQGRWICGLCGEAVKDEIARNERRIGTDEALKQHMSFCKKFKALRPPPNPTEELISAVKQLLLRSLDSPRSSPMRKDMVRSHSCMSALDA